MTVADGTSSALLHAIRCDAALWEDILLFRPVPLSLLAGKAKTLGLKGMRGNRLKDFCDSHGITFSGAWK